MDDPRKIAERIIEDNPQPMANIMDGVVKNYGESGVEVFKMGLAVGYLLRGSEDWWK